MLQVTLKTDTVYDMTTYRNDLMNKILSASDNMRNKCFFCLQVQGDEIIKCIHCLRIIHPQCLLKQRNKNKSVHDMCDLCKQY